MNEKHLKYLFTGIGVIVILFVAYGGFMLADHMKKNSVKGYDQKQQQEIETKQKQIDDLSNKIGDVNQKYETGQIKTTDDLTKKETELALAVNPLLKYIIVSHQEPILFIFDRVIDVGQNPNLVVKQEADGQITVDNTTETFNIYLGVDNDNKTNIVYYIYRNKVYIYKKTDQKLLDDENGMKQIEKENNEFKDKFKNQPQVGMTQSDDAIPTAPTSEKK